MKFTDAQQSAIDVRNRTLLVSAAAGSGKTFTLTQRIIKSIIEDGQDLSKLLIVTFTRAAAGELKAKISKALGEAITEYPQNTHLQEQLIKLGSARISTIDSFFAEPVKANFEKLGLPASMRMADEAELSDLRERLMQETLDLYFDKCEAYKNGELSSVGYSDTYTKLIGIISDARDSSKIIPTLCDIYKRLITSPLGIDQLRMHADRLKKASENDFFDTLEGQVLRRELAGIVDHGIKTLSYCCDNLRNDELLKTSFLPIFEENLSTCISLLSTIDNGDYQSIATAFENFSFGTLRTNKYDPSPLGEMSKRTRKAVSEDIQAAKRSYFGYTDEQISHYLDTYSKMSEVLYGILSDFDNRYSKEKLHRGVCEFSDMPRFMLSLLVDCDGNPTEYADSLYESFDEVYIDEYQDVNEIQDRIFEIIGRDHRFMVGDIKQSIYGFREAEPSIFADYRKKLPIYDKETDPSNNSNGNTIFMSENFRCDENVILFTNNVCSNVFSAFNESISYTQQDDLKFAKTTPEGYQCPKINLSIVQPTDDDKPSKELNINDEDSSESSESGRNLEDEAIVVANQIAEMLRHEKNADGTPIKANQIAVLVRSHGHAKPLLSCLNSLNIKYALSSKGELFEDEDMKILVDLLSVIDNPRSDMPLCHLLTSRTNTVKPVLSLEQIVTVRKAADGSKSLYDALMAYGENNDGDVADSCKQFVTLVEKMRATANKISADKMIKSLVMCEPYARLTETSAYTYIYDCACKFVKNGWSSLYSFLKYFKKLVEKGESGAEPDLKGKEAVTVMSIHQSKGLEFNVCILFGFGKQFNTRNRYPLVFNKNLGVTMKLPPKSDGNHGTIDSISTRFEDNPIRYVVNKHIKNKQIEEEARIFYVALTRARERLYISATLPKTYDKYTEDMKQCLDLSYQISKGRSYIDWILLSLHNNDFSSICNISITEKNAEKLTRPFPRTSLAEVNHNLDPEEENLASLMKRSLIRASAEKQLSPEDKNARILATVPSKVAASKVSSSMLDNSVFTPIPTGLLFSVNEEDMQGPGNDSERLIKNRIELMRSGKKDFDSLLEINKKPTAAEIGTATHRFLQFCDYDNVKKNGVDHEIRRLLDARFITKRTADIISRSQLDGFFNDSLFSCIESAKKVYREFHFGMFKPASNFTKNEELKRIVKDKKIFVQGSIDLIIETESGEIIVCDYKTDRISPEEKENRQLLLENMRQKHSEQLDQYRYAVKQIFGKEPSKVYIYALAISQMLDLGP